MQYGDLSNEPAPTLAVRFEGILRTEDGKLNRSGKGYLQSIGHFDVNVLIITDGDDRKAKLFCYKWGISYNKMVAVDSILEIPYVCREMDVLAYYDMDKRILQNVNSQGHGKIQVKEWTSVEVLSPE